MGKRSSSIWAICGVGFVAVMTLMFAGGVAHAAPQYDVTCSSCHSMPPLDTHDSTPANQRRNPDTGAVMGNHSTHATSSVSSCTKCHKNEVTAYGTSHRNKQIEFSDALGYGRKTVGVFMNQTTVLPTPSPTCSTAACHSNGKGVNKVTPGWGTTAVNCSTCHDSAPASNSHTKHISGYSYGCVKCHADHSAEAKPFQHATSAGQRNIDVKFVVAPNVGTGGTFATNQCSNLYCHSNGLGTTKTVTWGGSVDCSSCHGDAATLTSNSHTAHLAKGYGCVDCHSSTASSNSSIGTVANHVDANVQVTGTKISAFTKVPDKTCTTSCHLTATPKWGQAATGACGTCHATSSIATGNHAKHLTTTIATAYSCGNCHTGATVSSYNSANHYNGTVDQMYAPDCSTAYCHSDGTKASGFTRKASLPVWGGASVNCKSCHGGDDGVPFTSISTGRHRKHLTYVSYSYGCVACHNATVTSNTGIKDPAKHVNSSIDVEFSGIATTGTAAYSRNGVAAGTADSDATKSCSNVYCHSNAQKGGQSGTAILFRNLTGSKRWSQTGTVSGCSSCHGSSSTTGMWALSGKHVSHINATINTSLGKAFACNDCHANGGTNLDRKNHANGFIQYSGLRSGALNVATGECSNLYCHSDGKGTYKSMTTDNWFSATTFSNCAGCHGTVATFAAPSYANGGAGDVKANSHANHVASSADCVNCHANTTTTGLATLNNTNHINGFANYSNGSKFTRQANKTCSNISCHSGNGIVANVPNAQWGASLGCSGCHADAATLNTNAHSTHLSKGYGCADCHSATASNNTTLVPAGPHANAAVEVAGARITSFIAVDKSCSAATCHGSSSPKWNVPTSADCGSCHGITSATLTTGSHVKHLAATGNGPKATCSTCHTSDAAATHVNFTVNLLSGINKNGTCGTCHTVSESWGAAATTVSCQDCHTGSGSTIGVAAPLKSLAATAGHGAQGQDCTACHDSNSDHISGTLGDNNRLKAALGTDNGNCLYCHNTTGTVTNPAMLNMAAHQTSGLGSKCADCHDAHGTSNSMMVNSTINGTAVSFTGNNTFANGANNGVCQVCHTTTSYFKANGTGAAHVDSTENCLRCHSHNPAGTGNLAFMPNGGCDACHGYPPVPRNVDLTNIVKYTIGNYSGARFEDYSGGGGAHIVAAHLSPNVRPSDGFAPCLSCHQNAEASHVKAMPIRANMTNVTVKVDPKHRLRNDIFPVYTSAKFVNGGGNVTGRCFNVDCHFKKSEKWSNIK